MLKSFWIMLLGEFMENVLRNWLKNSFNLVGFDDSGIYLLKELDYYGGTKNPLNLNEAKLISLKSEPKKPEGDKKEVVKVKADVKVYKELSIGKVLSVRILF